MLCGIKNLSLIALLFNILITLVQGVVYQKVGSNFKPEDGLEIISAKRQISISASSWFIESVVFEIINKSLKEQNEIYVAIPRELSKYFANSIYEFTNAFGSLHRNDELIIPECDTECDINGNLSNSVYVKILFTKPLKINESLTISSIIEYIGGKFPQPEKISQLEPQFVKWYGSKYIYSCYPIKEQSTEVTIINPVQSVFESENSDVNFQSNKVNFGPYNDIKPFNFYKTFIRFQFTGPIHWVKNLQRDIWVSHWGSALSIEETYNLTNNAAELINPFSRIDYMKIKKIAKQPSTDIMSLHFDLDRDVFGVYYTDQIGNVSTSNLRRMKKKTSFNLMPRFPIFGGWNYTFTVGWNQNLKNFVRNKGNDEYILRVPFLTGPESLAYEEIQLDIYLPEGAYDVDFASTFTPYNFDVLDKDWFLDTKGRTTLRLKFKNIASANHDEAIFVTYKLTTTELLKKPITLISGFFALFSIAFLFSKVDLGLDPDAVPPARRRKQD